MAKKLKKGSAKNKSKGQSKLESSEQVQILEELQHCSSCAEILTKNHKPILKCEKCSRKCHKVCLDSSYNNKDFICDQCRDAKRQHKCYVCDSNAQHCGILKVIGNLAYHVDCILYSSIGQFQEFTTLKIAQKRVCKSKSTQNCRLCGKKDPVNTFIKCQLCQYTVHYKCFWIVKAMDGVADYSMIPNYLNVCQKSNYLLDYLCKQKKFRLRQFLVEPHQQISRSELLICDKHPTGDEKFCWCACEQARLNSKDLSKLIGCSECGRYTHIQCTNLGQVCNIEEIEYVCKGCSPKKNIFLKEMKLHELLEQVIKIEHSKSILTQQQIRFLNAFPFNYSQAIEKQIQQNQGQIQLFFIHKQLNRILLKNDKNQEEKNHARLLVLHLLNGDKNQSNRKKLSSPNQITKILDDIEISKNIVFTDLNLLQKIRQTFKELLEEFKSDDGHTLIRFKEKISQFIHVCTLMNSKHSEPSIQQLSDRLFEVSQLWKEINQIKIKSSVQSKFIEMFSTKFFGTFFYALIDDPLDKQSICIFLNKYGCIKYLLEKKKDVTEEAYWRLKEEFFISPEQNNGKMIDEDKQNEKANEIIKDSFKKLKVKSVAVIKQEKLLRMRESLVQQKHNLNMIDEVQYDAIVAGVSTFGRDSEFEQAQIARMEKNILRKKFRAVCEKQDAKLVNEDIQYIQKLENFIKEYGKYLSSEETIKIQCFQAKLKFISFLLKMGEPILQSMQEQLYSDEEDEFEDISTIKSFSIEEKLKYILRNWNDTVIPYQNLIPQLLDVKKFNVKFDSHEIQEEIVNLVDKIANLLEKFKQNGRKIKGPTLNLFIKLLEDSGNQKKYEQLQNSRNSYQQWINLNSFGKKLVLILQNPEQAKNLGKTLGHRLSHLDKLQFFDLSNECAKMRIAKIWCQISQKVFSSTPLFGSKKKPTINAVQCLKNYCEKVVYPKNSVIDQIMKLNTEGSNVNKQIAKFLQKPKYIDFLQLLEELQMINQKITKEEALVMKKHLLQANLDVQPEIQQLQQEIKEFEEISKSFEPILRRSNFQQMKKLRARCLESAIKHEDLSEYHQLVIKIYEYRCQNFVSPTTKRQYYQLISLGGIHSLELSQKTANLLKVYKQIDKAQNELASCLNISKRNFMNLIPWDEKIIRQMKQELRVDPSGIQNFEKAKQHSAKLRETYTRYRNIVNLPDGSINKIDLKKLNQLETDLSFCIFNHKDVIVEITSLKRDHEDMIDSFEAILPYSNSNMIAKSARNDLAFLQKYYIGNYRRIRIRNESLDSFEEDCRLFKKIFEISNYFSKEEPKNIKAFLEFNMKCKLLNKNFAKLKEVMDIREKSFFTVFQVAINSPQPLFHLWNALIDQGLDLRELDSKFKVEIFDKVFELHSKIKEFTRKKREQQQNCEYIEDEGGFRGRHHHQIGESQSSDDSMEDEGEDEDDEMDEFENSDDYDDFDDSDDEMESSEGFQGQNKGRKIDNNQIILDDD